MTDELEARLNALYRDKGEAVTQCEIWQGRLQEINKAIGQVIEAKRASAAKTTDKVDAT